MVIMLEHNIESYKQLARAQDAELHVYWYVNREMEIKSTPILP